MPPTNDVNSAGEAYRRLDTYPELKQRIRAAGLLDLQPRYYALKITLTLGVLAILFALTYQVDGWMSLAVAAVQGVMFTQVAMLGHDLQHRQVVRKRALVSLFGVALGDFLLGVSYSWWSSKHNAHHGNPNRVGSDPDIDFPVLAFSEEQLAEKRPALHWLLARQAYLFFPFSTLQAVNMQLMAFDHAFRERPAHRVWEATALIAHVALYVVLLAHLGWLMAIASFMVQMGVAGLYNGIVFAPNHKGMVMFGRDEEPDFATMQVLSSRNVYGHPITDFVYGGLNYQIEHHLCPTMPRNNLHRAQPMVREYCAQNGLPYVEESATGSIRAILSHLHEVSAGLRTPRRNSPSEAS